MLQSPKDKVFVEITNRYEDEIQFQSGVKLYIDPSFNPNFHATSVGVVHSVPASLSEDNAGIEAIVRPGDEVLFSYKTVGDITYEDNTSSFRMTTKGEGYLTEWMNQERETIRLEKGMKEGQWVVIYTDKTGALIDGRKGSQGYCENWIAQNFKFASAEGFEYDNRFYYEGKELWQVDYSFIFAIRRKGHLRMVGDYLLIEPIVENRPLQIMNTSLIRPESERYCVLEHKGWLRCGGRGREGYRNGDVLIFHPDLKEKYNVEGKPMYIVRKKFLLGREESVNSMATTSLN